jgi:hypothetical protein
MTDIIDLQERKDEKSIDPEFRQKIMGEKWYKFLASYEFRGNRYTLDFWALDMDDAKERIDAIKNTLKLDGQIHTTVSP